MLKYIETEIVFSEVPDEVSLAIDISGCPFRCEECHSPQLREDIGKPLDWSSLNALIHINSGITCVCFLGGDAYPKEINDLAFHSKRIGLKTAWYSGRDCLSPDIDIRNFDYIKIGPYVKELGPINVSTTNQVMYKIEHVLNEGEESFELIDITNKFWNKKYSD